MSKPSTFLAVMLFKRRWVLLAFSVASMLFAWASASNAQTIIEDPLHGCITAPTPSCTEKSIGGNPVTPTNTNTPNYGFTISPGPQSGTYMIVTLIPDNLMGAGTETFSVLGGSLTPATATLSSSTPWTTGNLVDYLGIGASLGNGAPKNPITAFLPTTQVLDPTALGYFVYVAHLGTATLQNPNAPVATPSLFDGSFILPGGTSIVGFLNTGTTSSPTWISTAQSGQLAINTPTPPTVTPEPASMLLFGTGLFAIGGILRRRKSQSVPAIS
jgi:hypothetical protein